MTVTDVLPCLTSTMAINATGSILPMQIFEATRTQHGGCGSRPKEQGDGTSAQFVAWFDTAFTASDPLKQKAILASQAAALAVLAEACQRREGGRSRPLLTQGDPWPSRYQDQVLS